MSILQKLTEGLQSVNRQKESHAMVSKWAETGLLEGLEDTPRHRAKSNIAMLLENQAKELLREASQMSAGDVEGFAAVAFPIVRRVFGGLVANELVSVQPMSLPSGLIFFLDFTYEGTRLGETAGDSVYGGGVVGQQVTSGVNLDGANVEDGFYNLNNGYSSPTGSTSVTYTVVASGNVGGGLIDGLEANSQGVAAYVALGERLIRFDPDLVSGTAVAIATAPKSTFTAAQFDFQNLVSINPVNGGSGQYQRRLTVEDPLDSTQLLFVNAATASESVLELGLAMSGALTTTFPINDNRTTSNALGSIVGTTTWGLENNPNIPEIDIKVDSISIEADTKKLKAKWTPELQQDINAYQNLDAEVELTSILSEHIALEIDQEILEDLIKQAAAGVYHWSRRPGRFLNRTGDNGGSAIASSANEALLGADFTGNVSEWYETLVETINEVSAQIHRKTLRGGANFIVIGPEVANILEFTAGFRASTTADEDRGEVGAVKVGSIRKKWDVFVDPYFPRNLILVGRRGSSFLESGYVYAPYVPLQVTPTIFGTEDFVPRKGVMTRYGKKMIRADMYGLVIVQDMIG